MTMLILKMVINSPKDVYYYYSEFISIVIISIIGSIKFMSHYIQIY